MYIDRAKRLRIADGEFTDSGKSWTSVHFTLSSDLSQNRVGLLPSCECDVQLKPMYSALSCIVLISVVSSAEVLQWQSRTSCYHPQRIAKEYRSRSVAVLTPSIGLGRLKTRDWKTRDHHTGGWKTRDQWLWNADGTSVVKQFGAENIQELVIFYML